MAKKVGKNQKALHTKAFKSVMLISKSKLHLNILINFNNCYLFIIHIYNFLHYK